MRVPNAIRNRNARVAENGESAEHEHTLGQPQELRTGCPGLVDVRARVVLDLGPRTLC